MNAFINEFHYDNASTDIGEFIEIAGPAGTNLTGWSVVLYNGNDGTPYTTTPLAGVLADEGSGYGFLVLDYPSNGIQNGAPDGIALVDDTGTVVEFLSYEGSFVAVGGPADGLTSTEIGVSEPGSTISGFSLQRIGNGTSASDFTFAPEQAQTKGAVNTGQTFGDGGPGTMPTFTLNEIDSDQNATDNAEFIEIFDGGVGNASLDGMVVVLFNGSNDLSYRAIDLTGYTTDDDGFFVIGSENVPNVDLVAFTTDGLQNGADAVALYTGTAADFPANTAPTTTNLIDAIVYDTSDADDTGLLAALGQTVQHDENATGAGTSVSLSRVPDGGAITTLTPTPGAANEETVVGPQPTAVRIHEIQGNSAAVTQIGVDDISALLNQFVSITAVVTADYQSGVNGVAMSDLSGFFLQEEDADADTNPFTSEGIFVFDDFAAGLPNVAVGDVVTVTGTVQEFFGMTQLRADTVTVQYSGAVLPTPTTVDFSTTGAIKDALGNYVVNLEAVEGMLIEAATAMTVTEMFNLDRFGEYRVSEGRPVQYTQDNAPDVAGYDAHLADVAARSLVLDDGRTIQNPFELEIIDGNDGILSSSDGFRMGDQIADLTGVVYYGFDEFRLHDATGTYQPMNPRPDSGPEDVGGTFKVASLNVLNFFTTIDLPGAETDTGLDPRGADSQEEFDRQVVKTVDAILGTGADVLGLVEIENSATDAAVAYLVDALNARLGADVWAYVPTGIIGTDAITTALIYNTTTAQPVGDIAILESFNGISFVDPLMSGSPLNRPALAQTFADIDTGETLTIAVNHLKSKGSSSGLAVDNDAGDGQGASNATREAAADLLADWLATDPTGQGATQQLIIGDLNAYAMEDPIVALQAAGFVDVASALLGDDAYSYVFDGQIGTLDYALANAALFGKVSGITEWHINADEPDALDYNLDFGRDPGLFDASTPARNSDHDPVIIGFNFVAPPLPQVIGTAGNDKLFGTDAAEEIIGLGGRVDKLAGGLGADVFIFAEFNDGERNRDKIVDFEIGIDSIQLDDAAFTVILRDDHAVIRADLDRDVIRVDGIFASVDELNIQVLGDTFDILT